MIQRRGYGSRTLLGSALIAATFLAACDEKETFLPGKREDIRSVLTDPVQAAPLVGEVVPENTTRAIALGPQRNNDSWSQAISTETTRVAHPALSAAPQLAWSADIGQGDSRKFRITANPVVAGGRIFTLDAGAQITATSTAGATLWSRDLTPTSDRQGEASGGGLAIDGDTLYASVGYGVLAALDAATGATRWTQDLESSGSGTPTVSGDLVYLTAGDDTGWAINKSDGSIAWRTGATPNVNNVLGQPAPAVTSSYAIFGYGSGEVQAVFRRGGLLRWDSAVVGKRRGRALASVSDITGAPVVSGNTVFVGNQSGRIEALNLGSGAPIWVAREGAIGPVWPVGDSVFALTDLNELVRLDATTGARIWGVPLPNFVKDKPKRQSEVFAHHGPIVAGGKVIVASNDGVLRSFDPTDGMLTGQTAIPNGATTAPVVAGGTLYVVSTKGQLHAFR